MNKKFDKNRQEKKQLSKIEFIDYRLRTIKYRLFFKSGSKFVITSFENLCQCRKYSINSFFFEIRLVEEVDL